jgi:hypothetical protein
LPRATHLGISLDATTKILEGRTTMEQAQDSTTQEPIQSVSPLKAAIALLGLLGAALLGWYLTRPDAPAVPGTADGPAQAATLTEAEAIKEFERLFTLNIRAYRERDESLVRLYAAPDAPKLLEAHEEIRQLLRDGVLDRTRFKHLSIDVTALSSNEVVLTHIFEEAPRFVDEATGRDVTASSKPRRITMRWVMRRYPTGWLLYRGAVIDVAPLS